LARVAVGWPVRAQPQLHAGTADIPDYLGRCRSRSCNHELARDCQANRKSRYQPRPMVRST
jgi:putative ribosome biogenesis GTPase RsgA